LEEAIVEIRLLISRGERRRFATGLAKARASVGSGFMETRRSCIGQVHLQFGELYGLFDEARDTDRMLAGFATHALDMFGQSYPKPDLTHLPPQAVFEVGELWSCSPGAGVAARWGCGILAGLRHARALLIYPIIDPWDLTDAYPGFEKIGAPIPWPFAQTIDGGSVRVQPMVAQGTGLEVIISMVSRGGFEATGDHRVIRFPDPLRTAMDIRAAMRRARRRDSPLITGPTLDVASASSL
jgi:hypothetical protein